MGGKRGESLKNLVCAGIVGLVLAGAAGEVRGTLVDSNSIIEDNIEYYMQTDKSVYDLGESVEMLYRVTNLRDEEVTFCFCGSPEWNFWVEKDGENIWTAVRGWFWFPAAFDLSPGESKEFPVFDPPCIWNMRDDEDNLVNVGEYNVIGGLDGAATEFYDFTRVSVPITIIPEPSSFMLFMVALGVLNHFNKKRGG